MTEIVDIHITHRKYNDINGIAVELGGIMSEISKLNVTTESSIVISRNISFVKSVYFNTNINLRNVNFSPLSGAKTNPSIVIQLIRKQGTIKKYSVLKDHKKFFITILVSYKQHWLRNKENVDGFEL